MRKGEFFEGGYYHIYNRGVEKRDIFLDEQDYLRFLANILVFQGELTVDPFSSVIRELIKPILYNEKPTIAGEKFLERVLTTRYVEVLAFILMPNHFHLIVRELKRGGVSKYMSRTGNSFTKYFNVRYERVGRLFEKSYNFILIDDEQYMLHLSGYIHKNVSKLSRWEGKEQNYPWSSFSDYTGRNRWGGLLRREYVLESFDNQNDYENFVNVLENNDKTNL